MRKSNRIVAFSTVGAMLLMLCLSASQTFAADFRYPQGSQDYRVQSSENVKNLYAAASTLTVDANAGKDAVVAGNSVTINGNVSDDLLGVANNMDVRGSVGGTARVAGATIHIDGKIGDDLVIAGANVYVSSSSAVAADAVILAANATIDAPVHGNISFKGGTLEINGTVDGNVDAYATKLLKLGPNADIKGNLNYRSGSVYERDPNAKVAGTVSYNTLPNSSGKSIFGLLLIGWLGKLVAMLLVAWLLFAVFQKKFKQLTHTANNGFWKNVGIGAILLVLVPIAAVVLLVILIGYYAALVLLAWYALMLLLGALIGAAALGAWLQSSYSKVPAEVGYWNIFLGVLIFSVIGLIPIAGWIVDLIIALAGFGALCRQVNQLRKEQSDGNV